MRGRTEEAWRRFCERAAVEQDPDKLLELVKEINRMLEEKESGVEPRKDNEKK